MTYLNWLKENFWSVVLGLLVVSWLFGDAVRDAFYAIVGLGERRGLSRKEQRRLRSEAEKSKQALAVAVDILRDVQAADRVFPQLPQDTAIRVNGLLAEHLKRPELDQSRSTPRRPDAAS